MKDFRDWLDDACRELCIPKGAYVRTYNCILRHGLDLEKLAYMSDDMIDSMRNCGKKTAVYIRQLRDMAQDDWAGEKKDLDPIIITLCGPLRNQWMFDMASRLITAHYRDRGCILLEPYLIDDAGTWFRSELWEDKLKQKVHFQKIDLSDMIVVIDGLFGQGEIGYNSKLEIEHAVEKNIPVKYLSDILKLDI